MIGVDSKGNPLQEGEGLVDVDVTKKEEDMIFDKIIDSTVEGVGLNGKNRENQVKEISMDLGVTSNTLATLVSDMADQEIGMDPRECTSRSPSGQRDRYPSKAQGESPVPLVPASPTLVEARGDPVSLASPVPLVPEEARDTRPTVPIVPPP
ncbi:hypothetical protein R3W88_000816 [Solanum pinnatisectum]|uniref:Uncharacterized protein n=1 Tax=Solanum pinnatisectum TaxID=50273 RepID=A0AAV9MJD1_9SOLN|nr:hypothetical protein R3W88_000816 [Solanum pinnatisectum]